MAEVPERPLLNPVLSLKMEAVPETQRGGGKGRDSIKTERLGQQQAVLATSVRDLYRQRAHLPIFAGKTHLLVRMFADDSLAPSYTPDDLFGNLHQCQLVAPFRHGYVVEADVEALPVLAHAIENPKSVAVQCDISRVESVTSFSPADRLRRQTEQGLWNEAPESEQGGKLFVLWLSPFRDNGAQEALLRRVAQMTEGQVLLPTYTSIQQVTVAEDETAAGPVASASQSSVARAMRSYRNTGVGRAVVAIPTPQALGELVASGLSHRIDPVRPIATAAPGEGVEPAPPLNVADAPVVGVIDGGLHASSYSTAEAWRAPPLVSNSQAHRRHGNAVSSLVVQGYAWNANRPLPPLTCRIGSVQALAHPSANRRFDEREFLDYLAAVMRAHPETRVWNISANQEGAGIDPDEVSVLGHELRELARAANILPVISIGNRRGGQRQRLYPPADCEPALAVGGREANAKGQLGGGCPECLGGPGPDGMLKPDISWFSELRMLGGVTDTGSSYPTALVSSLAAHTFANLKDPTPDLVKALLVNAGERKEHDPKLGWGTPFQGHMPWSCGPGSVTLAWKAHLVAGANYYWNEIPIPPEMIREGKLFGRAKLTAVLRPLVSPFGGANYFASRLQTSLRCFRDDDWEPLVGSMLESTLKEEDARKELKKWQPVRCHYKDFSRGSGIGFEGNHLQLYARVYMRDLYQFGWSHHSQAGPQEVAFVLTLWSGDNSPSIYNSTIQALGNFVESAVVNQEIEIRNN
jgi:hypothetical protein